MHLFKQIMADEKSFPKDQPYKDLVALITFILRKFFKAIAEDSFVIVEVGLTLCRRVCHTSNRSPYSRRSFRRTVVIGSNSRASSLTRSARSRRAHGWTTASRWTSQ